MLNTMYDSPQVTMELSKMLVKLATLSNNTRTTIKELHSGFDYLVIDLQQRTSFKCSTELGPYMAPNVKSLVAMTKLVFGDNVPELIIEIYGSQTVDKQKHIEFIDWCKEILLTPKLGIYIYNSMFERQLVPVVDIIEHLDRQLNSLICNAREIRWLGNVKTNVFQLRGWNSHSYMEPAMHTDTKCLKNFTLDLFENSYYNPSVEYLTCDFRADVDCNYYKELLTNINISFPNLQQLYLITQGRDLNVEGVLEFCDLLCEIRSVVEEIISVIKQMVQVPALPVELQGTYYIDKELFCFSEYYLKCMETLEVSRPTQAFDYGLNSLEVLHHELTVRETGSPGWGPVGNSYNRLF
ncbi:unnamed protein product [Bursaphelenchus okinawaensis]|uniref:Uncharacterized protein n=1 Tax=Bursaphelenchus okinawaensis TaxID=465554 RepID=A0A811KCH5_9BILA|nr:unnamed protein product [Bursaphelenchus okinawaensis]CAG9096768.1 unnamed protein product [Bursaphelenchus okinawaensis]